MRTRAGWPVGALVGLALGGCAATTAAPPSTTPASPTATPSVVEPSRVSVSVPGSGSGTTGPVSDVSSPSGLPTTSNGGVTMGPLPAGLTAAEISEAEAAIEVYRRYWALSDQALAEPQRDWSQEAKVVANGTAADSLLGDIASFARDGVHATGHTGVESSVAKVEPAIVHLTGCVDVSGTDVIDSSGQSVKVVDGPDSHQRFTTSTQIGQVEGGSWLVTVDTFDQAAPC